MWTWILPLSKLRSSKGPQVVLVVKSLPANAGDIRDTGSIPGSGQFLEEGTAKHSSILAWRFPWTEKPGRLQSTGSQRVRHNGAANTFTFTCSRLNGTCTMPGKGLMLSRYNSPSQNEWVNQLSFLHHKTGELRPSWFDKICPGS